MDLLHKMYLINYGSIESGDNSMVADSAYFDVGVEYSNVTENDGFNQRVIIYRLYR